MTDTFKSEHRGYKYVARETQLLIHREGVCRGRMRRISNEVSQLRTKRRPRGDRKGFGRCGRDEETRKQGTRERAGAMWL